MGAWAGVDVAVDVTWVGDSVGSAAVPVGVAPGVTGVSADVDGVVVDVDAGLGPGVGISGACVGTRVGDAIAGVGSDVASWVGELAANAIVAALGPRCTDGTVCGISFGIGAAAPRSCDAAFRRWLGLFRSSRSGPARGPGCRSARATASEM